MRYSFPLTREWLKNQLADNPRQMTLYQKASDVYAAMLNAIDSDGSRSSEAAQAAGTFGGLVKRFKAGLLQTITMDIIKATDMDTGRLRIRSVQREIFGHAQASKDLKVYARIVRNGGGRAAPMPEIPDRLKRAAYELYIKHQDDLKTAVQSSLLSISPALPNKD